MLGFLDFFRDNDALIGLVSAVIGLVTGVVSRRKTVTVAIEHRPPPGAATAPAAPQEERPSDFENLIKVLLVLTIVYIANYFLMRWAAKPPDDPDAEGAKSLLVLLCGIVFAVLSAASGGGVVIWLLRYLVLLWDALFGRVSGTRLKQELLVGAITCVILVVMSLSAWSVAMSYVKS